MEKLEQIKALVEKKKEITDQIKVLKLDVAADIRAAMGQKPRKKRERQPKLPLN